MSVLPHHGRAPPTDTSCVDGVAMHENDDAILQALDLAWRMPSDELIGCETAICNMQGEVYRRAAVKGVAQMLMFEERMAVLGFAPELEESEHDGSGFDIIFRHLQDESRFTGCSVPSALQSAIAASKMPPAQ